MDMSMMPPDFPTDMGETPAMKENLGDSGTMGHALEQSDVVIGLIPDVPVAVIGGWPNCLSDQLDSYQGDNLYGAQGDCGLVSASNVCGMAGLDITEDDALAYAQDHGLCNVSPENPEAYGGTNPDQVIALLDHYGIDSQHFAADEVTYDDLAAAVESGHGVILGISGAATVPGFEDNATYDAYGNPVGDHWVCATATVRDGTTGELTGFLVCDSGMNNGARYISLDSMDKGFQSAVGGDCIVTSQPVHVAGVPAASLA
jgi:hypothetical protein